MSVIEWHCSVTLTHSTLYTVYLHGGAEYHGCITCSRRNKEIYLIVVNNGRLMCDDLQHWYTISVSELTKYYSRYSYNIDKQMVMMMKKSKKSSDIKRACAQNELRPNASGSSAGYVPDYTLRPIMSYTYGEIQIPHHKPGQYQINSTSRNLCEMQESL